MEVPRHWRLQKTRYGLVGDRCLVCGDVTFPPKDICNNCTTGELLERRKTGGIIYDGSKTTSSTPMPVEQVQG